MIEFITSNKLLMLTLFLIVGALVSYKVFFLSGDSSPLLTSSSDVASSPGSQDLLAVLVNLRTIHLNDAVFSNPVFASLNDFGVEISPEPAGRPNPFAPYVSAPASSAVSGSTTASTSRSILILPLGKKK